MYSQAVGGGGGGVAGLTVRKVEIELDQLNRGYYMAARGYEFYLRVVKVSLTSERSYFGLRAVKI